MSERRVRRMVTESFVIVVSILFAFWIDAWWEGRQEDARRVELVEGLTDDFQATRSRLAVSIAEGDSLLAFGNEVFRLTRSSPVLPLDSLRRLTGAFTNKIDFEPSLSTYEAALGSGELTSIRSTDFRRAVDEFRRARDFYELTDGITAQLFFLGPTLELRRRVGSLGVLQTERSADCEVYNSCYPPEFALDARELQGLLLERDVFGMLETVQNANRNIVDQLNEMDKAAEAVLRALEGVE